MIINNSKNNTHVFIECLDIMANLFVHWLRGSFPTKLNNYCVGGNYVSKNTYQATPPFLSFPSFSWWRDECGRLKSSNWRWAFRKSKRRWANGIKGTEAKKARISGGIQKRSSKKVTQLYKLYSYPQFQSCHNQFPDSSLPPGVCCIFLLTNSSRWGMPPWSEPRKVWNWWDLLIWRRPGRMMRGLLGISAVFSIHNSNIL